MPPPHQSPSQHTSDLTHRARPVPAPPPGGDTSLPLRAPPSLPPVLASCPPLRHLTSRWYIRPLHRPPTSPPTARTAPQIQAAALIQPIPKDPAPVLCPGEHLSNYRPGPAFIHPERPLQRSSSAPATPLHSPTFTRPQSTSQWARGTPAVCALRCSRRVTSRRSIPLACAGGPPPPTNPCPSTPIFSSTPRSPLRPEVWPLASTANAGPPPSSAVQGIDQPPLPLPPTPGPCLHTAVHCPFLNGFAPGTTTLGTLSHSLCTPNSGLAFPRCTLRV